MLRYAPTNQQNSSEKTELLQSESNKQRLIERLRKKKDDENKEEKEEGFEQISQSDFNDDGLSVVKEDLKLFAVKHKIQEIIGTLNYEVGQYLDLVEKFYKLFTWTEPQTSDLVLSIFVVLWIVVSFIPIRPVVALGIIGKFNTESKFYKRRYISNV